MAWLKPMLKLQSAFRAPSRFARSAAQHLGKSTQHLGKGPQPLVKSTQHLGKGTQHLEKDTQHLGKDSSPVFEIRSSPGKGLGVFATKDILRNVDIMRDPLAFRAWKGENLAERHRRFIMLPVTTRQSILKLSEGQTVLDYRAIVYATYPRDNNYEKESIIEIFKLDDIIDTNAFTIAHDTGLTVELFLNACRINHSCIPNADQVANEGTGDLVMRANRDINADEEITTSYIMRAAPREIRQRVLSGGWGFTCQCPACDPSHPFSHSHEQRLHTLLQTYKDSACYLDDDGRLKSAETWPYAALEQVADSFRRRTELLTEHHSLRSFTREVYLGAFEVAVAKYKLRRVRSDLEEALKLLELTIQAERIYFGEAITRSHEELYAKLERGDISGV
ncbi:hypothetical protein F5144DRAFT_650533 [Chaetomium tenue]|uniref:Uncharacterized protein n=1 Tax=Chaetomium tenue TaxID=1854479 RepID=A0ACB7P910_9PEZI|nr:hypothetical protein F5144DRAFT_650533 [Chaetomium globosum]